MSQLNLSVDTLCPRYCGPSFLSSRSSGQAVVLLLLLLPLIFGLVAIVLDGGILLMTSRELQNVADASAYAGSLQLAIDDDSQTAETAALEMVDYFESDEEIQTTFHHPPLSGDFAGDWDYVEVTASRDRQFKFANLFGGPAYQKVSVNAVAGIRAATSPIVVIALDPDAPDLIRPVGLPVSTSGTALLGSLELLGVDDVSVNGTVVSNSIWGGFDSNGEQVGDGGPPYAISGTPLLPANRIRAIDVRTVGGVDSPSRFQSYASGGRPPLAANRFAVPDPLENLPTPVAGLHAGVSADLKGHVTIATLPLFTTTLDPGIYESINIVSGRVHFNPGIYIIRNRSLKAGLALDLSAGIVTANDVMFYVVNDPFFDASSDDTNISRPPTPSPLDVTPSVVLNLLPGSSITPIQDPASPFAGMSLFQSRQDQSSMVVASLFQGFSGTVYSKWGHLTLVAKGEHDVKIASGTIRLVPTLGDINIDSTSAFPGATDSFLVE